MKVCPARGWAENGSPVLRSAAIAFHMAMVRVLFWAALLLNQPGDAAVSFAPAENISGLGFMYYVSLHNLNRDGLSDIAATGSQLNILMRQRDGGSC